MKFVINNITSPQTGQVQLTATVEDIPAGDEQRIVALFNTVQAQTSSGKFTFWEALEDLAIVESAE